MTYEYTQARLCILSDVMQFYLTHQWGDEQYGKLSVGLHGTIPTGYSDRKFEPQVGDLVTPTSIRGGHKWYIAWLREIEVHNGSTHYLLESIEDGELQWWTNVGINIFPRSKVRAQWSWTDKQFAFNKRWQRTFYDISHRRTFLPIFNADGSVTLSARMRFAHDEEPTKVTKPAWKKITIKQMKEIAAELNDLLDSAG